MAVAIDFQADELDVWADEAVDHRDSGRVDALASLRTGNANAAMALSIGVSPRAL